MNALMGWTIVIASAALIVAQAAAADAPVYRFYPDLAQRHGVSGRVALSCVARSDYSLTDCKVASETPAGWGFGVAALKISHLIKVNPATKAGQPGADGRVTVPITFEMPGRPPPPPPLTPSPP